MIHSSANRGFGIITALFVLAVLGLLGGFIVSVATGQHVGSAQDLQGARALHAARAGIEWGLYKVQIGGGGCPAATTELSFPAAAETLAGMAVTVECASSGSPTVYKVTSTACTQPNASSPKCPNTTTLNNLYVERRVEVIF